MKQCNHEIRVEIEQKVTKMEAPLKVKLNTLNDNLMKFKDLSLGKITDLVDNNEDFIATKFDE